MNEYFVFLNGAILKVWVNIGNPTLTIHVNLLQKNPAKFHPVPIWNDKTLRFFLLRSPQQEQEEQNK